MPSKQRGLFRTIGMRMLDFGRRMMRNYVPPPPALPPPRYSPPSPSWEADTQTPLVWDEGQQAASAETANPIPFEAPLEIISEPPPRPVPQRRAPARTVQRQQDSEEKIDPRLLAILAAHQEREDHAAQVREERKAAEAAEIQRQIDEGLPDTPLPSRRRHRASFDYVETKPLLPPDEEISHSAPPKAPPADTIQTAPLPDHEEDEDDDVEGSSPAETAAEDSLPPTVQRTVQPPTPQPVDAAPPAPQFYETTTSDEGFVQQESEQPSADDYSAAPDVEPVSDTPIVQRQMDTPPAAPVESYSEDAAPDSEPPAPSVSASVRDVPSIEAPPEEQIQPDIQTDEPSRGGFETLPDEPPAPSSDIQRVSEPPVAQRQMDTPPAAPVGPDMEMDEQGYEPPVSDMEIDGQGYEPPVPDMEMDGQGYEPPGPDMEIDQQGYEPPAVEAPPGVERPTVQRRAAAPDEPAQTDMPITDEGRGESQTFSDELPIDDSPIMDDEEPPMVQSMEWTFPSIGEETRPIYLNAEESEPAAPTAAQPVEDTAAPTLDVPTVERPTVQRSTVLPDEAVEADMQTDEPDRGGFDTSPYEAPAEPSMLMREETPAAPEIPEALEAPETLEALETPAAPETPEAQPYIETDAEPETVQRQIKTDWTFPSVEEDMAGIYFDVEESAPAAPASPQPPERAALPPVEAPPTAERPIVQRRAAEPAPPEHPAPIARNALPPEADVPLDDEPVSEQPVDVFQGLVDVGMVPAPPESRPSQIARKAEPASEQLPFDEDVPPEAPVDVYQALLQEGMVSAPPGERISREAASPQETPASSAEPGAENVPVRYASQPNTVMRTETENTETTSSTSSTEQGGGDVNVDKLARDVYSELRNRLRIEKERRG